MLKTERVWKKVLAGAGKDTTMVYEYMAIKKGQE